MCPGDEQRTHSPELMKEVCIPGGEKENNKVFTHVTCHMVVGAMKGIGEGEGKWQEQKDGEGRF